MNSAVLFRLSALSIFFTTLPTDAASGSDIMIEFEPMGAMNLGANPFDMLNMVELAASPTSNSRANLRSPAKHQREAELDDLLNSVMSTVLMPPTISVDPRSQSQMRSQSTKRGRSDSGAISGALLRDLFPGPLGPMVVQEEHAQPFSAPDPFVMDMMQAIDSSFANEIMQPVHKAVSQERTPNSCEQDIRTKCQGFKSHLHCLGQLGYNNDITSEDCRKDVGHSVPFVCATTIDKWCNLLDTGILDCLQGHMVDLDTNCRDAVFTTQHIISKANTHKASLVDPATGGKKVSRPAVNDHEAKLDTRLGIVANSTPLQKWGEAMTSSTSAGVQSSSFLMMRELNVAVLFLTVIGIVAYMIVSQGKGLLLGAARKWFVLQKAPEVMKLVTELPKSPDL